MAKRKNKVSTLRSFPRWCVKGCGKTVELVEYSYDKQEKRRMGLYQCSRCHKKFRLRELELKKGGD